MEQKETIGFVKSFKLIMKNNCWLLLVGVWVSMALGMTFSGSVATYYPEYFPGK